MKKAWRSLLYSEEFEQTMFRLTKPIKELREEWAEEASDGGEVATSRQMVTEKEIKKALTIILNSVDQRRFTRLSRGACKEMLAVLAKESAKCAV